MAKLEVCFLNKSLGKLAFFFLIKNAILVLFLLLAWIFWFWEYQKKTSIGSCYNLRELIETRHFFELLWRRGPLRFPQDRGLRSTSRMSQAVSKRLTRMTRKSSWFPTLLPDIYKVLHCRGYEIGTFFFRGRWKRLDTNILWWFFEGFPENHSAFRLGWCHIMIPLGWKQILYWIRIFQFGMRVTFQQHTCVLCQHCE